MRTTVSVVLPVYNEAENPGVLVGRLTEVLERATGGDFVGEYLGWVYDEVRRRSLYILRSRAVPSDRVDWRGRP